MVSGPMRRQLTLPHSTPTLHRRLCPGQTDIVEHGVIELGQLTTACPTIAPNRQPR